MSRETPNNPLQRTRRKRRASERERWAPRLNIAATFADRRDSVAIYRY
jgi:hypothetical protein